MNRSLQLPYLAYVTAFLQTDLFLVHLFFCEREVVPVRQLVSCDWFWHSRGSLIRSKNKSVYENAVTEI